MMSDIKFRSKAPKEIQFSKELKKRVRSYFKDSGITTKGDFSMHVKSVAMLGLYLIPFIILLSVELSAWFALLMVVLMGIGEAGIGMSVMHDAVHGAYSNKKWVNRLVGSSMYLLGSNTINWKIQHNVNHHSFTNIYGQDPDISTKAIIRLSDHAPLKKYHRFQQFYAFPLYGLMTISKFFGEISSFLGYNREGLIKRMNGKPAIELTKLILTKLIYLFIIIGLPLLLTTFSIWQVLIGFMIMHLIAGMIMSTVFQMAHVVQGVYQPIPDHGIIPSGRLVHQLRATSDFGKKGGILSWFLGGLDFQVEHHLFPNICHVHYAAIAPIVEQTAKEYGVTYNTNRTFAHAIVSHYKRLKELGRTNPT
jgi:linoleoyl-CoA desaturase